MKFAIRQAVAVPPARAMLAYGSPAFYEGRPARDDIEVRDVVHHEATGERILLEVRFAFTGSVSAAAERSLWAMASLPNRSVRTWAWSR